MFSTFPNNSLLCVQFLALTAIFIIVLPLVLPFFWLTIQIYPFIIINAVKNFCPQPIFSIKFITHILTPARYLPVFFDTDILPFPLFPFFFPFILTCRLPSPLPLPLFCPREYDRYCHQISISNKILF